MVYSDSPKWKEYVETAWLPAFGDKFIVLNWSERKKWPRSVPVFLFYHYCQAENFNPAAIILRGAIYPLIYRFYPAFQDTVHGKFDALTRLENLLFEELGLDVSLINHEEHYPLVTRK